MGRKMGGHHVRVPRPCQREGGWRAALAWHGCSEGETGQLCAHPALGSCLGDSLLPYHHPGDLCHSPP